METLDKQSTVRQVFEEATVRAVMTCKTTERFIARGRRDITIYGLTLGFVDAAKKQQQRDIVEVCDELNVSPTTRQKFYKTYSVTPAKLTA